jgi:iron complex outermembrane recepter protein
VTTIQKVECKWQFNPKQVFGVLILLGGWMFVPPVQAEEVTDDTSIDLSEISVTGHRASLKNAQAIKRDSIPFVDSITSDSIQKLPDYNTAEAMQRVPGIQITRDRGEGSTIAIRGLTQVETTLNGREVFTAGNGRVLDYSDISAELLSQANVYKTASANHIEGGVGGLVDLRTHYPFDFDRNLFVASGRYIHGDFVNESKPQISLLSSNVWQIGSSSKLGVLANLVYQDRAWREDIFSIGNPRAITVGGQSVIAPNGEASTVTVGERKRLGANLIVQWQPSDRLDLYGELHHAYFKTIQNGYQLFVTPGASFDAASVSFFPNTNDLSNITWNNPAVTTSGAARDTLDRTTQAALGGRWIDDRWSVKTDVSHTKSFNMLDFSSINLNGTSVTFNENIANNQQVLSTPSFANSSLVVAKRPFHGTLDAIQIDGDYDVNWGQLSTLSAGVRLAQRHADDGNGQVVFSQGSTVANASPLLINSAYVPYPIGDPELARDWSSVRNTLGISATLPNGSPLGAWKIGERTTSQYVMATFQGQDKRYEGNIGLRNTLTDEKVDGYQTNPAGGDPLPLSIHHRDADLLPSTNWRFDMGRGVYFRAAASQTVTRPDFNQISPSLTLNVVQLAGTAGNPALRPIKAENYDWGLEYYWSKTSMLHLTHFIKHVNGFVTTLTNPEVYNGATYQVSRPFNTDASHIDGWEVGYQQFYDFLPGWLSGFGLQANFTHIDSQLRNVIAGKTLQLPNVSKDSYNLVAMYEKGNLSARLAYNWRSKFMTSVLNVTGFEPLPVFTDAYGWMDASINYRPTKQLTLGIEGLNLLNTVRKSYAANDRHPLTSWKNDREITFVITLQTR